MTLPGGGDVIEWRPANQDDTRHHPVVVLTVVANHSAGARHGRPAGRDALPGSGTAQAGEVHRGRESDWACRRCSQDIAHNPGNKLSTKKQADFALENGTWLLKSIE